MEFCALSPQIRRGLKRCLTKISVKRGTRSKIPNPAIPMAQFGFQPFTSFSVFLAAFNVPAVIIQGTFIPVQNLTGTNRKIHTITINRNTRFLVVQRIQKKAFRIPAKIRFNGQDMFFNKTRI